MASTGGLENPASDAGHSGTRNCGGDELNAKRGRRAQKRPLPAPSGNSGGEKTCSPLRIRLPACYLPSRERQTTGPNTYVRPAEKPLHSHQNLYKQVTPGLPCVI